MTKGIVQYACDGLSPEQISQLYKRSVLVEMYICLYTIEPPKRNTVLDIAYSIWNFLRDEERTADLCKLLT